MSSTGPEDQPDTATTSGSGPERPDPSSTPSEAAPGAAERPAAPSADAPASDTPASDTPASDTPASDTPASDTPASDTPASGAPASDTPASDGPTSASRTGSTGSTSSRTAGSGSSASSSAGSGDAADRTETTALPRTGPAAEASSSRSAGPSSAPAGTRETTGTSRSATEQTEATTVMHRPGEPDPLAPAATAPERDVAAERAAARAERQRALGVRSQPTPEEEPADIGPTRHNTDRFLGSLGLFLLRLVVAAIMGVHGAQKFLTIGAGDTSGFADTALPYPDAFFVATAIGEVLIALALVLGLLVRVAGIGVVAVSVGALALVYWYQWPFEAGTSGFAGELELLLAGVGLLLACVGGGWWGIDAAMRRGRARRRSGV